MLFVCEPDPKSIFRHIEGWPESHQDKIFYSHKAGMAYIPERVGEYSGAINLGCIGYIEWSNRSDWGKWRSGNGA